VKTEYLILWVDDEVDSEDVVNVREFLDTHGVRPDIRLIRPEATSDMHALVSSIVNDPNLDLIIVDNKMFGDEGGMDGNQLIQQIRESDHVYLPVIFYSSGGIEPLMAAVQEQKLDGVYLTGRDQLVEKAKTVITSLLRKEQTIKQTRGLLMEGVSEIDAKFGKLFAMVWAKLSEDQMKAVIEYFHAKIKEQEREAANRAKAFPLDVSAFWKEMSENFVSSAYPTSIRWKVLKKALDSVCADHEVKRVFSEFHSRSDGETAIVTLRNHYGHRTRLQLADNHTEEMCIKIRRELRRQQQNLDAMEKLLEPDHLDR
jgi:CheY-like chemotaxis protein